MKVFVNRFILIFIVLLQSHFWIVLTQELLEDVDHDADDGNNNSSSEKPKNVHDEHGLHVSLSNLISSSAIGISMNYSTPHISTTPFISEAASLVEAEPLSLLNTSIRNSSIDTTSSHENTFSSLSHIVEDLTYYLLNSSYPSEPQHLLKNSFHLLDSSNNHVSGNEYYLSPSLSETLSIYLSSSYVLHQLYEDSQEYINSSPSKSIIIQTPSADSRILIMTSGYATLHEFPTVKKHISSIEDFVHSSNIQSSSVYNSMMLDEHTIDSYSLDKDSDFRQNKPTLSLSEKVTTDFSNFFIETRIVPTSQSGTDSINLSIGTTSSREMSTLKASEMSTLINKIASSILESYSIVSNSAKETEHNNTSYPHETIMEDISENNKTLRNEDAEIDEILSGIIHLLAGNVQVKRPVNQGYDINPTRQPLPQRPPLVSTRINNRGPFRPTVVVFSQPPNNGPHLHNPVLVRIHPTKVGDHPPSAVSVIHFYGQGPKIPSNPQPPHIPFAGEIFNPNLKPNTNVRISPFPNEYVRPSFVNPEKQQAFNGNAGNKYPHFIFSEQAASSVVVIHPSKQQLPESFEKLTPGRPRKEDISKSSSHSQNFEVLIDDPPRRINFSNQTDAQNLSNFKNLNTKKKQQTQESSKKIIPSTTSKDAMPHGPITDWVPFTERPSASLNESYFLDDSNVSIITHPIVFDLTVSNSMAEVLNTKNSTSYKDTSPVTVRTTEFLLKSFTKQPSTSMETTVTISTPTPPSTLPKLTELFTDPALSISLYNKTEILPKYTENFSDLQMSSETSYKEDISSTPTTKVTAVNDSYGLDTISSSNPTLKETVKNYSSELEVKTSTTRSSSSSTSSIYDFGIGSFFTEKRAFIEHTEKETFPTRSHSPVHDPTQISKATAVKPTRSYPPVQDPTQISKATAVEPSHTTEQTLLGRPIVIPVDIEEVRPYVGSIDPPSSDRNKENSFQGPFPGSPSNNSVRRITPSQTNIIRSNTRPRPNNIRIDTCIVGDDTTCDVSLNETCRTELGISSCHCLPGHARTYPRAPCIPIVSLMLSMKVDRLGNQKIAFTPKYLNKNSDEYRVLEFEARLALTTLISQIPAFSRTFQGLRINTFYPIGDKLVINSTIFLEEKESTRTQAVRLRLRHFIGEAIKKRNQNLGDSSLYVESSFNPIVAIEDVNECSDSNLNDCSVDGLCFNVFGTYLCKCRTGYVDPFSHDERRSGRKCSACSPEYCTLHGKCYVEREKRLCKCHGNYIGSRCEIDGEVLGVALGASLAAIIIILLTLGCLCIWNRKWRQQQQQQKAEVLSSRSYNSNQTFSHMGSSMMNGVNANPYHLTIEDRMRWAQISDVMKNVPIQPNPEMPYLPPVPSAIDHIPFSKRCHPIEEDISWSDNRSRPRSRASRQFGGTSAPSCFEMDLPGKGGSSYGGTKYHSSKRQKHQVLRY